jgi:dihydrofolate synthase / folylpolyglutamate synthase
VGQAAVSDYRYEIVSSSLAGQEFRIWDSPRGEHLSLQIGLLGSHQVENAAVAYAALRTAHGRGIDVELPAIQTGFAQAVWPGRFEVLQAQPPLVVDSAHNRDSARKLRQALEDYFPDKRVILIYGASEDKDITGMFDELLPRIDQVIVTRSFHPRAADPQVLQDYAARYGHEITIIPAVEEALAEALRRQNENTLVLATGSIFIAAAVRESWYNQK